MTLTAAQERNYREVIAATRAWCAARGLNPAPYVVRAVFVWVTESGGVDYANDGAAFHPDPAQRRPGWDRAPNGDPLPAGLLADCYRAVRVSLDYPHDAVGNNGGSTGGVQQLSQDYVAARFPGKTWGYGTVADTMQPALATRMFLDRVKVTGNPVYGGITFSDPLVADVLDVQLPLVSESSSTNYSPEQVAVARAIVAQLDTQPDWIDMATPQEVEQVFGAALDRRGVAAKADLAALNVKIDALAAKIDRIPAAVWQTGQTGPVPGPQRGRVLNGTALLFELRTLFDQMPGRVADLVNKLDGAPVAPPAAGKLP